MLSNVDSLKDGKVINFLVFLVQETIDSLVKSVIARL